MRCSCEFESDCYVYLVKLVYANFQYSKYDDATIYVNGKQLDLSVTSLNSLASAPNDGKKFFDAYGWMGMSEVKPIDILKLVLDNPTLNEVIRPTASDLSIHRRILHHMGKLEKNQKSKEYNKKTLRLMGFMQNEDGEWVRKGVVTPYKEGAGGSESEEESEDEKEEATTRTETPPPIGYSSRRAAGSSHEPQLNSIEASMDEIKEEQKRLGKSIELATCMQTGFEDIKRYLVLIQSVLGLLIRM
ncbi:hypothetical protein CJ030_MR7G028009 [Morella rubra]|uniref:Uncharacterized protein n=1 Tax=Morella rubra TaxID=262757 RepID=A0A6A1V0F4_9ROSI|nr:hypothetical protein CJ030_MR7G028009 [Morella rubra]